MSHTIESVDSQMIRPGDTVRWLKTAMILLGESCSTCSTKVVTKFTFTYPRVPIKYRIHYRTFRGSVTTSNHLTIRFKRQQELPGNKPDFSPTDRGESTCKLRPVSLSLSRGRTFLLIYRVLFTVRKVGLAGTQFASRCGAKSHLCVARGRKSAGGKERTGGCRGRWGGGGGTARRMRRRRRGSGGYRSCALASPVTCSPTLIHLFGRRGAQPRRRTRPTTHLVRVLRASYIWVVSRALCTAGSQMQHISDSQLRLLVSSSRSLVFIALTGRQVWKSARLSRRRNITLGMSEIDLLSHFLNDCSFGKLFKHWSFLRSLLPFLPKIREYRLFSFFSFVFLFFFLFFFSLPRKKSPDISHPARREKLGAQFTTHYDNGEAQTRDDRRGRKIGSAIKRVRCFIASNRGDSEKDRTNPKVLFVTLTLNVLFFLSVAGEWTFP